MPSFARAAVRSCGDGQSLAADGRHVSADHLAGLGVECALKALLLGVAGVPVGSKGIQTRFAKHGSRLHAEVVAYLHGTSASAYFAPVLLADPFGDWDVSDRYEDGVRARGGSQITPAAAAALLATGDALIAQLQAAQTNGLQVGL
jgi:hypothetical protein